MMVNFGCVEDIEDGWRRERFVPLRFLEGALDIVDLFRRSDIGNMDLRWAHSDDGAYE